MARTHEATAKKPFIEHVHELQKRLTWSVLAVAVGGGIAYMFYEPLLALVQKPLGQTLYYTSPTGGFSFLFKICLAAGLILALPIILFHVFGFLGPLLRKKHKGTIVAYTLWSFDLAYSGVLFAYFISLPAALHFLANFGGESVQSLITADEYFNFALAYLAGFAVLFQVPLFVLFINKIKPLKPSKMMAAQRYVILGSFIVAAVLTPTPDPFNQLLMAAPAIVLYQVGIVLVMIVNHKRKRKNRREVSNQVFIQRNDTSPKMPVAFEQQVDVLERPKSRRVSRKFIDIIPPSHVSATDLTIHSAKNI